MSATVVGCEGAEAGLAIEEGQADGVPIIDAMDVETIRHV